ncbi:uncharacterized protein LOC131940054 [Physella acuta]|uniref:uncharacterized protein LOC131940054 n=1 Tax=Physella acuta TaxID=109671 RepID=UPI0027DC709E|nr:uncharacterized protein LOC131940054 [Physella acuta]
MNLCALLLVVTGLITCIDSWLFPDRPRPTRTPTPRTTVVEIKNPRVWSDKVELEISGYERVRYGGYGFRLTGFLKGKFNYRGWSSMAHHVVIFVEYCPKHRGCWRRSDWTKLCSMYQYPIYYGPDCTTKNLTDFPCYCKGRKESELWFYPISPDSLYRIKLAPVPPMDCIMPSSNVFDTSIVPIDENRKVLYVNFDLTMLDKTFLFTGSGSCLSRSGKQRLTSDRTCVGIGGLAAFILSRLLLAKY